MGSKRSNPSTNLSSISLSKTHPNKLRRQEAFLKKKKEKESSRRDERFRRKREEDKDPELRRQRLAKNVPITIDKKRTWDEVENSEDEGRLGASVDPAILKKRRLEREQAAAVEEEDDDESDRDSMLDLSDDDEEDEEDESAADRRRQRAPSNAPSNAPSIAASTTSTVNLLDLTPSSLLTKFPALFKDDLPQPKILVTGGLDSLDSAFKCHSDAEILAGFFPNAVYIRRQANRWSHKYSLKEVCGFAHHRNYTNVVLLKADRLTLTGMTIVTLPSGPSFTFSIKNFLPGKKIPGHGVADPSINPELVLNNFKTPLGLLTARLFLTLFPPRPDFAGRQVVTLHNQRDYIFVRRHRYIFRDKKTTEKVVVDAEGKEMKGVEGIRAGLQELGPRFTLKLRRVDRGIGRAGSLVPASDETESEKVEENGDDDAEAVDTTTSTEKGTKGKTVNENEKEKEKGEVKEKPKKKKKPTLTPAKLAEPEWEWKAGMEKKRTRFNL